MALKICDGAGFLSCDRGGKTRAALGHGIERQRKCRQAAAVHRLFDIVGLDLHPSRDRTENPLLRRMRGAMVAVRHPALLARVRQHAGVLAGAVVMDARRRHAGVAERFGRWRVHRRVRTAGQRILGELCFLEHRLHGGDVKRLAAMRRRAHGQLRGRKPEVVDTAALDERQHLEHLDRRSDEAVMRRVAGARHEALAGLGDRDVDAVHRLHRLTAHDFDDAACQLVHAFTSSPGYPRERNQLHRHAAALGFDEHPFKLLRPTGPIPPTPPASPLRARPACRRAAGGSPSRSRSRARHPGTRGRPVPCRAPPWSRGRACRR